MFSGGHVKFYQPGRSGERQKINHETHEGRKNFKPISCVLCVSWLKIFLNFLYDGIGCISEIVGLKNRTADNDVIGAASDCLSGSRRP